MIGLDEATPRRKFGRPLGCLALLLLVVMVGWGSFSWINSQARESVRYPDALPQSRHIIRSYNPPRLVEKYSFVTDDNFPLVYHWYSSKFDLGAEDSAHGSCIEMYGDPTEDIVPVVIAVSLCQTPNGQRINVTRYINFR